MSNSIYYHVISGYGVLLVLTSLLTILLLWSEILVPNDIVSENQKYISGRMPLFNIFLLLLTLGYIFLELGADNWNIEKTFKDNEVLHNILYFVRTGLFFYGFFILNSFFGRINKSQDRLKEVNDKLDELNDKLDELNDKISKNE